MNRRLSRVSSARIRAVPLSVVSDFVTWVSKAISFRFLLALVYLSPRPSEPNLRSSAGLVVPPSVELSELEKREFASEAEGSSELVVSVGILSPVRSTLGFFRRKTSICLSSKDSVPSGDRSSEAWIKEQFLKTDAFSYLFRPGKLCAPMAPCEM